MILNRTYPTIHLIEWIHEKLLSCIIQDNYDIFYTLISCIPGTTIPCLPTSTTSSRGVKQRGVEIGDDVNRKRSKVIKKKIRGVNLFKKMMKNQANNQ